MPGGTDAHEWLAAVPKGGDATPNDFVGVRHSGDDSVTQLFKRGPVLWSGASRILVDGTAITISFRVAGGYGWKN